MIRVAMVLIPALAWSPATAAPILNATVRDFLNSPVGNVLSHPDFTTGINGRIVAGLVRPTLGSDGTPDLKVPGGGGPRSGFITSSETFEQWFKDVPLFNTTFRALLPLVERGQSGGEVFRFEDRDFFPADGRGFDDDDRQRNYSFTVHVSVPFVYSGEPAGNLLTIGGDDDIWLFINGLLVADLGGVHDFRSVTVDLGKLRLAPGSRNTYDLFFAERHKVASGLLFDVPNPSPVPEPSAAWLLGAGLLGLAAIGPARRRRAVRPAPP